MMLVPDDFLPEIKPLVSHRLMLSSAQLGEGYVRQRRTEFSFSECEVCARRKVRKFIPLVFRRFHCTGVQCTRKVHILLATGLFPTTRPKWTLWDQCCFGISRRPFMGAHIGAYAFNILFYHYNRPTSIFDSYDLFKEIIDHASAI